MLYAKTIIRHLKQGGRVEDWLNGEPGRCSNGGRYYRIYKIRNGSLHSEKKMNIELFKIFSGPMPKGSREYTISMDVDRGTLILLNRRNEVVEETNPGILWCQAVKEIGLTVQRWFKLGFPVETGWAYPATVRGAEELGFFIQGAARMAEKLARQ